MEAAGEKSFLLLGIVLCAIPTLPQSKSAELRPLLIHHVTVIDATGAAPRPDMTVMIENGRIAFVQNEGIVRDGKGGAIDIDGRGKYLIPGLWDMHTHIAGVSANPKWSKETLLSLLVANGITGVRDMGGDLEALVEWKKEIAAGALVAPHLVVAGPMLELAKESGPDVAVVHSAEEGRKAVDDLAARGAPLRPRAPMSPEVRFDNAYSSHSSVLKIGARDRTGLMY